MNSSYLFINNLRVHYLSWNQDEGGRPVVLLHGLGSNARLWELVAQELGGQDLMLFAPDLRGHGLTDKPDGEYGFATFRRDLLAFIDAFPLERPVMVGYGWGALLALDYAAAFPIGPRATAGLFLVDGGLHQLSDDPGVSREHWQEYGSPLRVEGFSQEEYLSRLAEQFQPWGLDERVAQILLTDCEVTEDETLEPRLRFDHQMQITRAMQEFNSSEWLARVRCPIQAALAVPPAMGAAIGALVDKDRRAPFERRAEFEKDIQRVQDLLPNMQIHQMPDTIFHSPLQRPAELAQLIAGFTDRLP